MAKRIYHERIYCVHTNIRTVKTQQETKSSKHLGWIMKINATKKPITPTYRMHLQHSTHICSGPLFSGAIFLTTPSGEATKGFRRNYH